MEYLPNEGLLATAGVLFIELTTDAAGTSTGFAVRYQGERYHGDAAVMTQTSVFSRRLNEKGSSAVSVSRR